MEFIAAVTSLNNLRCWLLSIWDSDPEPPISSSLYFRPNFTPTLCYHKHCPLTPEGCLHGKKFIFTMSIQILPIFFFQPKIQPLRSSPFLLHIITLHPLQGMLRLKSSHWLLILPGKKTSFISSHNFFLSPWKKNPSPIILLQTHYLLHYGLFSRV